MKIIDCVQGSDEWHQARLGIPTASEFATVMAKGRGSGESKTRRTYMLKLAGERMTKTPAENYTNGHFDRGKEMEPEARAAYAWEQDVDPELVGFITNDDGSAGCSPDGLIGADGVLEIKTKLPHLLIDATLRGTFPPEHKAQCQGALWITEREWVEIAVYWPDMRPFIKRAYRDEEYIGGLAEAVERFNDELTEMIEQYAAYGRPVGQALRESLEVVQ